MIKVLIVDDQQLLLDLLSQMLNTTEDIQVVAIGRDGNQAIALTEEHKPDVILMDIQMPYLDGIQATERIKHHHEETKILMLTSSSEDQDVHRALQGGADGYVLKTIGKEQLISVIKSVHANMEVIHEDVREAALRSRMGQFDEGNGKKLFVNGINIELSERDLEIIRMIVEGDSTEVMAKKLFVSEGRLRNIITEIIQKLMVENRTQLAVFALKNNLV
jgi:DNA-binding NarL/FixJ family response regulator